MKKETRTVVYDDELRVEAYRFEGILQPFPNHFHEYYVIGFMEDGHRCLSCKKQEYTIHKGDIVLFNPGDNHACVQSDDGTLNYRGINIKKQVMLDLAQEVTGKRLLPGFRQNVVRDDEIACYLRPDGKKQRWEVFAELAPIAGLGDSFLTWNLIQLVFSLFKQEGCICVKPSLVNLVIRSLPAGDNHIFYLPLVHQLQAGGFV